MSDYDDFKNESKHNEMMLAIEGYVLDEVEKAVAAERARCITIIRDACFRGIGNRPEPTWQDIIERIEGGSDDKTHDGE